MSVRTPLLDTIEPDEVENVSNPVPSGRVNTPSGTLHPVVLTPTTRPQQMAATQSDAESGQYFHDTSQPAGSNPLIGIVGIFRQVRVNVIHKVLR
jgi:hypothetical protein